jgi:hypothetical protein
MRSAVDRAQFDPGDFNMLPPPLDGSKVIAAFPLCPDAALFALRRYGMVVLILLYREPSL